MSKVLYRFYVNNIMITNKFTQTSYILKGIFNRTSILVHRCEVYCLLQIWGCVVSSHTDTEFTCASKAFDSDVLQGNDVRIQFFASAKTASVPTEVSFCLEGEF